MKKLISGILALALLVSMTSFSLTASAASPVIASDILDASGFEADSLKIMDNTALASKGAGWNGAWVKYLNAVGSAETDMTSANNVIVKRGLTNDENGYYYSFASTAHYYYRGLANAIKATEDGIYYITFIMADGKGTAGANPTGTNFLLADKSTVSIRQSEAKGNFYLMLDDAVGKQMDSTTAYKFMVKVEVDADADDKISVEAVEYGDDFTGTWDLTVTKELGTDDIAYIGFSAIAYANACNFRDVVIEKYSLDNISVLEEMKSVIEDETVTGAIIERAIAALDEIGEGFIFDSYINVLKDYIEDNDLEGEYKAELTSSTVEADQVIPANSISSIDLEFTHSLDENTAVVTLEDTDGYELEINPEFDGNKVSIKLEENLVPNTTYTLSLTNLCDFMGFEADDVTILFGTDFIPSVNVSEGSEVEAGTVIEWTELEGVTTTVTLNEEPISNGDVIMGDGEAVLVVKAVNEEEIERIVTINFTITPPYAPVAIEVKITAEENTLTGSFIYSDKNGDEKGECILKWYYTDKKGRKVSEIDGAETDTYTITEDDYNHYIAFAVTPVALTGALKDEGNEVLSEPFMAPFSPVANSIELKGDVRIDETVEIKFAYFDENGDEPDAHKYVWYTADSADDEEPEAIEGAEESKYTVTEDIIGKYLVASVQPVSKVEPCEGEVYYTKYFMGPVAPIVKNVKITGTAKVGKTLTATYDFFDENLEEEKDSIIEWIDTDDDDVIGKGRTLKLTSAMEGKKIAVRVKGGSLYKPYYSEEFVVSESVTIAKSGGTDSGSGGYSGGFTMAGSSSGSEKVVVPEEQVPASVFGDVSEHWAQEAIEALYEKGIVSGTGDGLFQPNRSVTRAEMIKMMLSAINEEGKEYTGTFDDVKSENWFSGYVEAALDKGLISEDSHFRPNDAVTRQETAKLLAILMNYEITDSELEYADADSIAKWAVPYVGAVTVNGLMQGDVNNEFGARGLLTRAEAATVIYRIINK